MSIMKAAANERSSVGMPEITGQAPRSALSGKPPRLSSGYEESIHCGLSGSAPNASTEECAFTFIVPGSFE